MSKYYIQIVLAVVVFVGCAAAGYFLTPEDILSKSGRSRGNVVVATSAPTQYENPQQQEPVVEPAVVEPETTPNQPVVDESDVVSSGPATIEPEPLVGESDVPEIVKVDFPKFDQKHPKSKTVGYRVTVTAKSATGAALKYNMQSKDGKYSYDSTNGVFKDVYPTEDGVYTLVVTNTNTKETASREVSGLVKQPKRNAVWLEKQLTNNVGTLFYLNFAPNLKFKCYGSAIPEGDAPKTLNRLVQVAGMGFSVDVKDSTLKHDEWNRIVYFEVEMK